MSGRKKEKLRNLSTRQYAADKGVFWYEIAERLGISEPTMTRMLRKDLDAEQEHQLKEVVDAISVEKEGGVA